MHGDVRGVLQSLAAELDREQDDDVEGAREGDAQQQGERQPQQQHRSNRKDAPAHSRDETQEQRQARAPLVPLGCLTVYLFAAARQLSARPTQEVVCRVGADKESMAHDHDIHNARARKTLLEKAEVKLHVQRQNVITLDENGHDTGHVGEQIDASPDGQGGAKNRRQRQAPPDDPKENVEERQQGAGRRHKILEVDITLLMHLQNAQQYVRRRLFPHKPGQRASGALFLRGRPLLMTPPSVFILVLSLVGSLFVIITRICALVTRRCAGPRCPHALAV